MSKWQDFKNYINSQKPGFLIYRKDLVELFKLDNRKQGSTIDKWRRQLVVCGYLDDTYHAGVYRYCARIPESLTTSQLEEMYTKALNDFYKSERNIEWYQKSWTKIDKHGWDR